MTRRYWVVTAFLVGLFVSQLFPGFVRPTPVQARAVPPTRYELTADLQGMPYYLKLRHCAPAEDTLAILFMVEYDPDNSRIVYRCRKGGQY